MAIAFGGKRSIWNRRRRNTELTQFRTISLLGFACLAQTLAICIRICVAPMSRAGEGHPGCNQDRHRRSKVRDSIAKISPKLDEKTPQLGPE